MILSSAPSASVSLVSKTAVPRFSMRRKNPSPALRATRISTPSRGCEDLIGREFHLTNGANLRGRVKGVQKPTSRLADVAGNAFEIVGRNGDAELFHSG